MEKNNKLTKEELESIYLIQKENQENINNLGLMEFQAKKLEQEKLNIINKIEDLENKFQTKLESLKEKYGEINLDLSTGEFTEAKKASEAVTK
tara:strand:+ start:121 stop:399 length:279 start_codon:yes stop_codon:yes gene_type:complete